MYAKAFFLSSVKGLFSVLCSPIRGSGENHKLTEHFQQLHTVTEDQSSLFTLHSVYLL